VAEKFAVAAAHQVQPGTDQPDGAVAEVMCLPGVTRWHTPFAEQPLRNCAVGFAGEVCIERAKGERQSASSGRREVIGGAIHRLRSDGPPQAKRGVRPGGEILIEWDNGGSRCTGHGAGDEHNGSAILKDEILAVACSTPEQEPKGRDAARFTEFLAGGCEKNDRRSKMR
jgi:hypothetical protein